MSRVVDSRRRDVGCRPGYLFNEIRRLIYKYELLCHHNERRGFIANKCAEHIESLLRIILRIFLQYIWQHKPLHIGEYIVNKFTKFYTSTFYTFLGYASYKISI